LQFLSSLRHADPHHMPLLHPLEGGEFTGFCVPVNVEVLFASIPRADSFVFFLDSTLPASTEPLESLSVASRIMLLLDVYLELGVPAAPITVVAAGDNDRRHFESLLQSFVAALEDGKEIAVPEGGDGSTPISGRRQALANAVVVVTAGSETETLRRHALQSRGWSLGGADQIFCSDDATEGGDSRARKRRGAAAAPFALTTGRRVAMSLRRASACLTSVDLLSSNAEVSVDVAGLDVARVLPASPGEWDGLAAELCVLRWCRARDRAEEKRDEELAGRLAGSGAEVLRALMEDYEAVLAGPAGGAGGDSSEDESGDGSNTGQDSNHTDESNESEREECQVEL
jgi:hypothetical protein